MSRDVVNVFLDRHLDLQDLVEKALTSGDAEKARDALRTLLRMRMRREIDAATFEEAFTLFLFAAGAGPMIEAVKLARENFVREQAAVGALGPRLREVPAITNEDVMQRAAERKGLTDGEKPVRP